MSWRPIPCYNLGLGRSCRHGRIGHFVMREFPRQQVGFQNFGNECLHVQSTASVCKKKRLVHGRRNTELWNIRTSITLFLTSGRPIGAKKYLRWRSSQSSRQLIAIPKRYPNVEKQSYQVHQRQWKLKRLVVGALPRLPAKKFSLKSRFWPRRGSRLKDAVGSKSVFSIIHPPDQSTHSTTLCLNHTNIPRIA